MAQTDRQTDKATHWKSAIFDEGENFTGQYALLDNPPTFVKKVYKKLEICPTTGREHYQTHVECGRQVRLSQMCGWIKHTKWSPVIGKQHIENSVNYIYKEETTVPGAQVEVRDNGYLQLSDLLLSVAMFTAHETEEHFRNKIDPNDWRHISCRMLEKDITWANKLCNPTLSKLWDLWGSTFIRTMYELAEEGAYIIESPPSMGCEYNFLD